MRTHIGRSTGCLVAFSLIWGVPFGLGGVLSIAAALHFIQNVQSNLSSAGGIAVGLLFIIVGWGFPIAVLAERKIVRGCEKRASQFRDRPWMMRDDWAEGWSHDINRARARRLRIGWGSGFLLSALLLLPIVESNPDAAAALIFPFVLGITFLHALMLSRAARRFGKSELVLNDVPTPLGATVRGFIRNQKSWLRGERLVAELACVNYFRSTGSRNRRNRQETMWSTRFRLDPGVTAPEGVRIPIEFRLPDRLEESTAFVYSPQERVQWKLTIFPDQPNPFYKAAFELPVFGRSEQSPSERRETSEPTLAPIAPDVAQPTGGAKERPTTPKIEEAPATRRAGPLREVRIEREPGLKRYVFKPKLEAEHRRAFWIRMVISVGVVIGLMFIFEDPVALGMLTLALIIGPISMFEPLGRATVEIDADHVVLRWSFGLLKREDKWWISDVLDVRLVPATRIWTGRNRRWEIRATNKDGVTRAWGRSIDSRPEAEWVVNDLEATLEIGRVV